MKYHAWNKNDVFHIVWNGLSEIHVHWRLNRIYGSAPLFLDWKETTRHPKIDQNKYSILYTSNFKILGTHKKLKSTKTGHYKLKWFIINKTAECLKVI